MMKPTMRCIAVALVCFALTANAFMWNPDPEDLKKWLAEDGIQLTGAESFPEMRTKVLRRLFTFASDFLHLNGSGITHETAPADRSGYGFGEPMSKEYPYFGFIPPHQGSLVPGGASISFKGQCFKNITASATSNGTVVNGSSITVAITLEQPSSLFCSESLLLGTTSGIALKSFFFHGTHSFAFTVPANARPSEVWDAQNKGVRVFLMMESLTQAISDLWHTVVLFGSELTKAVPSVVAAANVDFLAKYRGLQLVNRPVQEVSVDDSFIQSGDFFGILRLDGLDPMLAWAMGATTGHTTVALRDTETGELFVTESTVKDSYWPTDGIQKTPFKQWLAQAKDAGYNVVHAPLTKEVAKSFNATAAWEFFRSVEGLEYGYHNMLFGWIDTRKDNFPCIPPDYSLCLEWEHVEVVFGNLDRLATSIVDQIMTEALAVRLGLEVGVARFADTLQEAAAQNMSADEVPPMVELDTYRYNTKRYNQTETGPAMVCCVFVCNMWKAAGLFDNLEGGRDAVNCAELTNWDDYSLTILDPNPTRPAQCVAADPDNVLCQLEGQYKLSLNDYSSKKPYPHMAERCGGNPPKYQRDDTC